MTIVPHDYFRHSPEWIERKVDFNSVRIRIEPIPNKLGYRRNGLRLGLALQEIRLYFYVVFFWHGRSAIT